MGVYLLAGNMLFIPKLCNDLLFLNNHVERHILLLWKRCLFEKVQIISMHQAENVSMITLLFGEIQQTLGLFLIAKVKTFPHAQCEANASDWDLTAA